MEHVDEVWDRLDFRTPWSKAREHDRVRTGLAGSSPGTPPTRAPDSPPSSSSRPRSSCPTASRCAAGYADRLELDEDGRVVVVDLKTGKYGPDKAVSATSSSALPARGRPRAVDELPLPVTGGAELSSSARGRQAEPVVQQQPAQSPTDPSGALVEQLDAGGGA
jgi:hypothetical protein